MAQTRTPRALRRRRFGRHVARRSGSQPLASRRNAGVRIFDFDNLRDGSILVIAPHPDDDVIGCGGILSRLAARDIVIRVCYVTDGSASHVRSKRFPPAALSHIREREAVNALHAIGVRTAPVFLRAADGALASLSGVEIEGLIARVAQVVCRTKPAIVFSPWWRDPHPDHVATAQIASRALQRFSGEPAVLMYGVWLERLGSPADRPKEGEAALVEVILSAVEIGRKRDAILAHRSQTTALIDDDPGGFRIDGELLESWLQPVERFYRTRARDTRAGGAA